MEQEYYISSSDREDYDKSELQENKPKKRDPHLMILALQGGICAVILIICLVIKLCFGDMFSQMKNWYDKNMATDVDVKQVLKGQGGPEETAIDIKGGFVLPVQGTLTSSYGYRADPFTSEIAAHNGLDIAAEFDSPIVAALSGKVVKAENGHESYGNYLVLDHGGISTLYGHCNKLLCEVGDAVEVGETIATCGSTGRSTGPHLHFEIRIGQTRIDPTPFLRSVKER